MKMKVSIAMEKDLVKRLDKIAAITNESRSQVIERMVKDQIESSEQFANLMANPEARLMLLKQFANPETMNVMIRAMDDKPTKKLKAKMMEKIEEMGQAVENVKQKGK